MDTLVSDDIPNIRFNVAKSYAILIDVLKRLPETGTIESAEPAGIPLNGCPKGVELINDRIMPNLEKLQQDDDVDVRYFASTAAQGWGDAMQT
jgi:serine/threonine-protein phosphatase 2A regulatory subunit A